MKANTIGALMEVVRLCVFHIARLSDDVEVTAELEGARRDLESALDDEEVEGE